MSTIKYELLVGLHFVSGRFVPLSFLVLLLKGTNSHVLILWFQSFEQLILISFNY